MFNRGLLRAYWEPVLEHDYSYVPFPGRALCPGCSADIYQCCRCGLSCRSCVVFGVYCRGCMLV